MNTLSIYRSGSVVVTVNIDARTTFRQKLMGEHRISSEFIWPSVLAIQIGDYVIHGSENFYINRIPSVVKLNNGSYQYNIDFESVVYDLKKKLYMSIDGLAEFGQAGITAADYVAAIVTNMNVNFSGWTSGTVDTTAEKTIVFSNENCYAALMKVAEAFDLEFYLTGKSISMVKSAGANTAHTFTYGRGLGLYKLERQQVSDQNIVTKVYGFGSMTNIPYTYRSGAKRLVFDDAGNRFLTKNTELYGIIEGQYTNDDIFPNRTAAVETSVMVFTDDVYQSATSYIVDSTIDFDISTSKIDGASGPPSIVFKSGDLAGMEFEIWKYDNVNKRIYFNPYQDENGRPFPDPLNQPITGDLYTLVNIALPQSYIDTAETALKAATQAYLDENSVPMVVYSVDVDWKHAKTNAITLNAGDRVTVVDTALGVNSLIRISGIEYPLSNIYAIKAVIADFVPYTLQERIIKETISGITETRIVDRSADEITRRNAMRQRQLNALIFDSDGYFDGTRIRPLSIETMYLSVGAKSQNFHLNGVTIQANYLGDVNRLYISSGQLIHHELEVEGLGYTWIIGGAYDSGPNAYDPNTAYYIYCKCSKAALTASWEVSATQLLADGTDGYYHLLCGVLYAVRTDDLGTFRDFDFTYGMSYINGRTITTGRVQSLNKLNYFDLDTDQFRLGDSNSSLDWNVTEDDTLTLIGALVQREPGGAAFPQMIFKGVYSPTATYFRGDQVNYNNETWIYINTTPADGITPAEGAYWTKVSSIGAPGQDGSSSVGMFQGEWSPGKDYYGTTRRADIIYYTTTGRYYIAKPTAGNPFRGVLPTNADYWDDFGGNFESLATNIFFAEKAFIENLGVRYFEGIPVGAGDLDGTVENTQANTTGTARIDTLTLTGTSGTANITVGGLTKLCTFTSDLNQTVLAFIMEWYYDYYAIGIQLGYSTNHITFREINGNDFAGSSSISTLTGNLSGSYVTSPAHGEGQYRIDTVTLTGTGGAADIICDGLRRRAIWSGTLTSTAADFASNHAAAYLLGDVVVTSDGADVIFTSRYKGVNFTGATSIINIVSSFSGAVSIEGNDIWEDKTNNSQLGAIQINMKGYNGGQTYYRQLVIGDGKGNMVLHAGGNDTSGKFLTIDANRLNLWSIPVSSTGLQAGEVYQDANGFLRIKL